MHAERKPAVLKRAAKQGCGEYISALDALHRHELFTGVLFDRLGRKIRTLEELRSEADENWNQTFYLLYFRTLGDSRNQQAYLTLARRVPYRIVLRERLVPHAVEAMLLGASGLLDLYRHDDYTLRLCSSFAHLAAKYDIVPMESGAWDLMNIRPANHPVLRLAQAAEFFAQDEFVMDRTMRCRTTEDIRQLFCVEAPEYWRTHYTPGAASDARPKRIGNFKANIIGINLVAVLQFAYGSHTGSEYLRDNALTLLERLEAEQNTYMAAWREAGGPAPENAFESQALLQLAREYCEAGRCDVCRVGRFMREAAKRR